MTDVEKSDPVFNDALFHQKRKHGKYRLIGAPSLSGEVADTHAHLQMLNNPALELARCAVHNVNFVCCMTDIYEDGTTTFDNLDAWITQAACMRFNEQGELVGEGLVDEANAQSLIEDFPVTVRIATGCHPHHAQFYTDETEQHLIERAKDPRVAAIGEIGLDYHYDYSPREVQRKVFARQLRVAKQMDLPVVLHVREAHDDAFEVLEQEGFPSAGVLLHCYNRGPELLQPWVEKDCFVAFGGPLTFKQASDVREAAQTVPLNRLLTETDSPFMTPEPLRGMPCGPAHTIFTAEVLCQVRGCYTDAQKAALLGTLMQNTRDLLDRPPTQFQQCS